MKRIRSLLLAVSMAAVGGTALGGAPEGSWYIAPQINALWLDDGRLADDGGGATLAIGRTLSTNWDGQISLFGSQHDRAGDDEIELQGFGLSLSRVFYREGRVNPFLTLGLGRVKGIFKPGADTETLSALYGAGLLIDLGGPRADGSVFQLRGDIGARRGLSTDDDADEPVDYVAGLGFQYSWGGTPRVLDSDGDGVKDDTDQCPGTPAGTAVDATGCPVPQDDDGDGVNNDIDKCPGTPAGAKVDATGCELDSDGDGVVDGRDQCPDTPKGDRVDAVGCSFKDEIKLPGVVFETNKAELLPESIPVLQGAIATLRRYPELKIEVAGHTDSRGSDAYNLDLSSRRASTVLKFLLDGGVPNSVTSRGYGERQPVAGNTTDEGRQQNRRVVLRVLN